MSKSKRYTDEFKKEAAKQVVESGYSVTEVSVQLGICTLTKTLYHWHTDLHGSSIEITSSDDQAEIARLK